MTDALEKNLTTIGFEAWDPKNCAEVDATQKATSAGVRLEHAHMFTVGTDYSTNPKTPVITPKLACKNCTTAFGSLIRDRDYSGWDKEMQNSKYEDIQEELEELHQNSTERQCGRLNNRVDHDLMHAKESISSISLLNN